VGSGKGIALTGQQELRRPLPAAELVGPDQD